MITQRVVVKNWLFFFVVCSSIGWSSRIFAADWYGPYQDAKQAVKDKDYKTAITLFQQAIAADPVSAQRKRYGSRTVAYYPYVELGMVYLATGDMEAAYQFCSHAQQERIEPKDVVDQCLAIASRHVTVAAPTPTPAPPPTPRSASKPTITLKSAIPAETKLDTLVIEGVASDGQGIATIMLAITNGGITGRKTITTPKRPEEPFSIPVLLDFGISDITIEATNLEGQKATYQTRVVLIKTGATVLPTPTPTPTKAPTTPPTPTPTVPLPTPPPTISPIELLLQQAKIAYKDKCLMSCPKGKSALALYQEVLQLDPTNLPAKDGLYEILKAYKSWGDNDFKQKKNPLPNYQKYMEVATFVQKTFNDPNLLQEIQNVQAQIELIKATPTPTPTLSVAATPTETPTPIVLTPTPTATPIIPTPPPTPTRPVEKNLPPTIRILSEVPQETTQKNFRIEGVAEDEQGIREVTIRHADKKGLIIEPDLGEQPKGSPKKFTFTRQVPLDSGANTIEIVAKNASGQEQKKTIRIVLNDVPTQAVTPPPKWNTYAMIIGIADYQDSRLNLKYTVNDAQGLYNILIDPNYGGVPKENIQLLLNEQATATNIKKAGTWLRQRASEDDIVIIYYSGHGAPEEGKTFWVTYDADINDLNATALDNNDIADMLSRIRSKRLITLLDSCYSEATVNRTDRTRDITTKIPFEKFSGEGRVTISASDGQQKSLEIEEFQHGVFTYYLLEGLRGKADDNDDHVIDVTEIWGYVEYQVKEAAHKKGNTQTPVMQGRLTAGFPLTFDEKAAQETARIATIEKQQAQLDEFLQKRQISTKHYSCAYDLLEAGKTNPAFELDPFLQGLFDGSIKPEVFSKRFKCGQ